MTIDGYEETGEKVPVCSSDLPTYVDGFHHSAVGFFGVTGGHDIYAESDNGHRVCLIAVMQGNRSCNWVSSQQENMRRS